MKFDIMTELYLNDVIEKQGELLGTLYNYINKDNQQPSTLKESNNVNVKVQRLSGENDSINKLDTSALHSNGHLGEDIV